MAITIAALACGGGNVPTTPTPIAGGSAALTPVAASTEWPSALPPDLSFDTARLEDLLGRIRRGEFGGINSLLIVRRERLAVEEYFNDWTSGRVHTLQSVSKSVTSLAAGLAIDRGLMRLTDRVVSLFPDYQPVAAMDANKQALTVRDLLTMRTGYDWTEQNYGGSPLERLNTCGCDWIRFMLDWPMREPPGSRFEYVSGGVILLGAAIERAVGARVDLFLNAELFGPLGVEGAVWVRGLPNSLPHTGGGLYLRPRDMAKIGTVVATGGRWQGRQVISDAWIRESTQTQAGPPHTFAGRPTTYGYLWWGLPGGITAASGARGQWIFIVPDRELVVVSTAENAGNESAAVRILFDHILPATR